MAARLRGTATPLPRCASVEPARARGGRQRWRTFTLVVKARRVVARVDSRGLLLEQRKLPLDVGDQQVSEVVWRAGKASEFCSASPPVNRIEPTKERDRVGRGLGQRARSPETGRCRSTQSRRRSTGPSNAPEPRSAPTPEGTEPIHAASRRKQRSHCSNRAFDVVEEARGSSPSAADAAARSPGNVEMRPAAHQAVTGTDVVGALGRKCRISARSGATMP
jgi:hypothetical protein